jgi:hypothetical protein
MLQSEEVVKNKKTESIVCTNDAIAGSSISEAMRHAVENVVEKKSKNGRVYGTHKPPQKRMTSKMRLFASLVAQGNSPRDAYRKSYNVTTANEHSVMAQANKLMRDDRVSAIVGSVFETVQETIVSDHIATRRHVMSELFKHAKEAKSEGTKMKALELMGRAVGMFTDKVEQKIEEVSTEQLKRELETSLSLLDNVTSIHAKRSA